VHEDFLPCRGEVLPDLFARNAVIFFGVHKVCDYPDILPDAIVRHRLLTEETRDGGDAVTLFDAELHHRQERGFESDKRDIRAVQRCDDPELAVQDLPGQEGAGGVRDGVVGMDKVQLFKPAHFHNLAGQCRSVEGELEEGVVCHLHFMIKHVSQVPIEPHRHGVTDEVDLVSLVRQRFPELGGHDAAAAVRGVTDDADLHATDPFGAKWYINRRLAKRKSTAETQRRRGVMVPSEDDPPFNSLRLSASAVKTCFIITL
jgi:hypothetical protein